VLGSFTVINHQKWGEQILNSRNAFTVKQLQKKLTLSETIEDGGGNENCCEEN